MSNYSEIILDPKGNTYVGDIAQPFAYGALKLPKVFTLDENTELFHVFEIMPDKAVVRRASVSTRLLAQSYMSEDHICVYHRNP